MDAQGSLAPKGSSVIDFLLRPAPDVSLDDAR